MASEDFVNIQVDFERIYINLYHETTYLVLTDDACFFSVLVLKNHIFPSMEQIISLVSLMFKRTKATLAVNDI